MTPEQILEGITENFDRGQKRKFAAGLIIAFIRLFRDLGVAEGRFDSLDSLWKTFPLKVTSSTKGVNTFSLMVDGKPRGIRRYYNQIENWFRSDQQRFDYPSMAPHATQAWPEYRPWLDALLKLSDSELALLEQAIISFVLKTLPSHEIDPASINAEPPRFLLFLEDFDLSTKKGEISGAAYQGTVFGYVRADAPHLQVEVGKVRTGSKREKRVGDIDARDGDTLVLSAEVKQFALPMQRLPELAEFANLIQRHKALGLIVALDFESGVREKLQEMGLQPLSRADLAERVRLWDPLKQKIAVNALIYYVGFKEKNAALYSRIKKFFGDIDAGLHTE